MWEAGHDQGVTPLRVRPHLAEILDRTRHVVVTFSVLGNLLPEPASVARQVGEMLREGGRRTSVLMGTSDNPFDMLAEAYGVSEEVGRRAEQLVHDAEVDAADWVPVTVGAAELLEACRATGRSVAVYAPHSESAVGRYLHRLGLRGLVGPALGRGFAMRNPAVRTLAPVFDAIGVAAQEAAVVCATFSAMSATQRAGAHAIGVERIREPRKVLHGGEGRNAVVRSLAALAEAIMECGPPHTVQ
jgi:beta-phosphoglucomutase-like phosphatase (HAD superfamily)